MSMEDNNTKNKVLGISIQGRCVSNSDSIYSLDTQTLDYCKNDRPRSIMV